MAAKMSTGTDVDQHYVTVTICIRLKFLRLMPTVVQLQHDNIAMNFTYSGRIAAAADVGGNARFLRRVQLRLGLLFLSARITHLHR